MFKDGEVGEFDAIVYATGYRPALEFLGDLLGDEYMAAENQINPLTGESYECTNLYFLGLDGQCTFRSRYLRGIVDDARKVAQAIKRVER